VASLFSTFFSALRPTQIDPRAHSRKVSVVDQQGLRRTLTGQEQAVRVDISADVADASAKGLHALPPGRGSGAEGHGDPSSYATMGRQAHTRQTAEQWQRAFGQAVGTPDTPTAEAARPDEPPAAPASSGAEFDEATDDAFVGHSWRAVVAMAMRAYNRIFDPDPTFSAVL
jgi:hypothetical protein